MQTTDRERFHRGDGAPQWAGLRVPPHLDPNPLPETQDENAVFILFRHSGPQAVVALLHEYLTRARDVAGTLFGRAPSEQPVTRASAALREIGRLKIELDRAFSHSAVPPELSSAITSFRREVRPAMSQLYRFLSITHRSFEVLYHHALETGGRDRVLAERILAHRDPRCEVGTFNFCWDDCDLIVDRLLGIRTPPIREVPITHETPPYQPTPARMVLELVGRLALSECDVFYDIGCGLFRVPALAALVSPARVAGVEIDPEFARAGEEIIRRNELENRAKILRGDIGDIDISDGTVFFLSAPLQGSRSRRRYGRSIRPPLDTPSTLSRTAHVFTSSPNISGRMGGKPRSITRDRCETGMLHGSSLRQAGGIEVLRR